MAETEKKSFWATLPGILTGAAGLIGAITALVALLIPIFKDSNRSDLKTPAGVIEPIVSEKTEPDVVVKSGLLAYYPFNGNTADLNKNGIDSHDAILHGPTPALDINDKIGMAYEFNGDGQYMEIPHDPHLSFGKDDFSISVWLQYGHQEHGDYNYSAVIIKAEDPNYPFAGVSLFVDDPSPGNINFRVDADNLIRTTGQHLNNNVFHHFVLMREQDVLKVYVDGSLIEQKNVSPISISNSAPVIIGANHIHRTSQNFRGVMDNLRLYKRALRSDEIQQLFTGRN